MNSFDQQRHPNEKRHCSIKFIMLFLEVFAFSSVHSTAQANMAGKAPMLDVAREHASISTDLANALVSIATGYDIPIVAELTATEDPRVDIMAGKSTARQLLDSLVVKSPEYVWKEQAGVVHFYNKTILNAPAHPLNFKLKTFQLPENVSQLKIFLPARLYNASQGIQEGSVAISAFPSSELEQQRLPSKIFRDTTGRDILLALPLLSLNSVRSSYFPTLILRERKIWNMLTSIGFGLL